jgi:hypothetical protein
MPRGRKNRFQQSPPVDADLVATHFQDLAAQPKEEPEMARRKTEIPPPPSEDELPEDPDEDPEDELDPEDEPEEADEEIAHGRRMHSADPGIAAPPPPATLGAQPAPEPIAPPPKKPRKSRKGGDRSQVIMGAAPVDNWPQDAGQVWERILVEAAKEHRTARDMYINVERLAISGYSAEPVYIGQIEGEAVEGGEVITPSTALTEYMIDVFHARASGPAKYKLDFNWKRGRRIKMGEFRFAHPHEMMEQRAYAKARAAAGQMPGGGGMSPVGMGHAPQPNYATMGVTSAYAPIPTYMQQPPYASQPPPYYPYPQPAQAASMDPSTIAELGYLRGSLNEALAAIRENRQPNLPPPPPTVAPPPADQEDARVARVVVGVLQSYGLRPGAAAPAVAQAQSAPVGFGAVVDRAREQLGGLKQVLGVFKEFEKLKEDMGLAGVAEEPDPEVITAKIEDPNSPAFGVRKIPLASFGGKDVLWPHREEDESLLTEWGPRFIAANPDMAMAFLEKAMRVLDQGAFGSLLGRVAQQGGPAAQAAQAMGDRMSNGAGVGSKPSGFPAP